MRVLIRPMKMVEVKITDDQYRAALRMEKYYSMPVAEQMARGHKMLLHDYSVHVTKPRSKKAKLKQVE